MNDAGEQGAMEAQDSLTPELLAAKKADSPGVFTATVRRALPLMAFVCLLIGLSGCSFGRATPTRTPFPTWTPTVEGQSVAAVATVAPIATTPIVVQLPTESLPPTATPEPLPTEIPTETPTPEPLPTEIPTETPTPEPTATAAFSFALEAAEKFPTDSLAANVVRIYLYVYSPAEYGLGGYTVQVLHNGTPLTVDEESVAGAPEQTRDGPSPFTRFANMSIVFVEPQAGRWEIQLLDESRATVGPPVTFDLTADERTRELYVRYRQQ